MGEFCSGVLVSSVVILILIWVMCVVFMWLILVKVIMSWFMFSSCRIVRCLRVCGIILLLVVIISRVILMLVVLVIIVCMKCLWFGMLMKFSVDLVFLLFVFFIWI